MEEKEKLLNDLIKAKKLEDQAKDKRIFLEEQIATLYFDQIDGKSKIINEKFDKNKFKITIKKNITIKLDQDAYLEIRSSIPENLRPEKITFSIDTKGYEWLKENNREIYLKVSDCVTETEGKISVKVEKI